VPTGPAPDQLAGRLFDRRRGGPSGRLNGGLIGGLGVRTGGGTMPVQCPAMSGDGGRAVGNGEQPKGDGEEPQGVEVSEARTVDLELVEAFEHLVPQLSRSNPPPSADDLKAIVASRSSVLLVARDPEQDGRIVGSLTLVIFRIPTGVRAWIEDVVVDEAVRGRGVGAALNRYALDQAHRAGARTVDLTSRPSREAANRLYQRLGFVPRETNVYRYSFD
jgi:ribosomal protein S18 acetylase RimI-like enzyme